MTERAVYNLMGAGHFECNFQTEGGVAHQPQLASETGSNYSITIISK